MDIVGLSVLDALLTHGVNDELATLVRLRAETIRSGSPGLATLDRSDLMRITGRSRLDYATDVLALLETRGFIQVTKIEDARLWSVELCDVLATTIFAVHDIREEA